VTWPEQGPHLNVSGHIYFHADVVEEVPFPGQGPGLEGLKKMLTRIRRAFPDSQWRIEEQIAEENRVLTCFLWSGTHQGEFLGNPATNRVVRVWGMVIDRFEGGKVKSTRILLDTLSLMQQLGVVPTAPEAGADPNAAHSSGHRADGLQRPRRSRFQLRLTPRMKRRSAGLLYDRSRTYVGPGPEMTEWRMVKGDHPCPSQL
jgi:steroid delta-isomerase-like uncharacterized protein